MLRSSGKHNAGSLWGGSSYTGKLQAHTTTTTTTAAAAAGHILLTTHTLLLLRLQAKERALLHAYYGPHNQELYALIGRDMGWEQMASPDAGQS